MANRCGGVAHVHRRDGVGAADVVEHERLAAHGAARAVGVAPHDHGRAERVDAAVLGDGLGVDRGGGVRAVQDDLAAGVEVLRGAREGDAGELAAAAVAREDGGGVEVAHVAAEGARDPLHLGVGADGRALGVEVVHVLGPVLDRGVAQTSAVLHEELDGTGVEVGLVVLGRGAALDEVQVGAGLHDDERVLELAGSLRVEAEVALQRVVERDALGDIHERSAAPHGVVQRRELVVRRGDERAEVLVDDGLPGGVMERVLDGRVDDALLGDLLAHVVVHDLGVVLCADACEALALGLGDAEALEGVLDVFGDVVPVLRLLGLGRDVRRDVIEVEAGDARSPVGGHVASVVEVEGAQAHLEHPLGLFLLGRDGAHDVRRQAVLVALVALLRLGEVVEGAVDVRDLGASPAHSASPSKRSKPFRSMSSMSDAGPSATMWPLTMTCVRSTERRSRMRVLCVITSSAPPQESR